MTRQTWFADGPICTIIVWRGESRLLDVLLQFRVQVVGNTTREQSILHVILDARTAADEPVAPADDGESEPKYATTLARKHRALHRDRQYVRTRRERDAAPQFTARTKSREYYRRKRDHNHQPGQ
jgi:hypothetical protein